MVRRKKAKGNALKSGSRRKAKDAAVTAQSEASASIQVMTGATMEDGMELLNNQEDVSEVGGSQDIEVEASAGEDNANEQRLDQVSGVIATDSMNSEEHGNEEVVSEDNVNEQCLEDDAYGNRVGIDKEMEVEPVNMLNEEYTFLLGPTEENDVKVLAEENVIGGWLDQGNATVTVGFLVGPINPEITGYEENCGDDIENEGEEEDEEEYEEVEEDEENVRNDEVDEDEDMVDDAVDDMHLEEQIHENVFDANGDEEDVVGNGNCQGIAKEQNLEEEENMVEAGENNLRNEVEETLLLESDGKTTNGDGDKKDVAGKVNCEGVVKEREEEEVEKLKTQEIIRSRKRIKTSTNMARSAGKLALKIHDGPKSSNTKKLKQGGDEDLKGRKIGEKDVPHTDNDKNIVAYGNKGKQKVGVDLQDNGGEKVQLNTEKKMGESSYKNKRKRLKQKSRWDPLIDGSSVKVTSEEGKSGLSSKKNGLSKAATKGMIFMCSSKTKQDCYRYMVLGLPAGKRELVEKIYKGMILFLYDVDKKLLNGIYKAAADGGYDLEPKAFNSKFPAQVRFEILEGCLPLEEEKFSEVIKDNYYTRSKFDCQLNSGQVENLCDLFRASIKEVKSERKRSRRAVKSAIQLRQKEREKAKAKVKEAQTKFLAESHDVRRPPARKGRHHQNPRVGVEVASFPRQPVRLSQGTTSSYAYERTLKREPYRGEPSVPHHEIYRKKPLLESRDIYRRELLLDRRDTYSPDQYLEHRGTSRQERILVPRDLYRVEQPTLQPRDSYRQYPVLERRDYNLKPVAEHRNYDLEPFAERHDSYRRQHFLLDHQDYYRKDPVLERQNRQQLDLEPRLSNIRGRADVLLSRPDYSAYSGGLYSTVQQLDLDPRHSTRRVGEDVLLSREDHSAYSGGLYSTSRPLRDSLVPSSHAVGLTTVYPSSSEVEPRYYSHRPVYRL